MSHMRHVARQIRTTGAVQTWPWLIGHQDKSPRVEAQIQIHEVCPPICLLIRKRQRLKRHARLLSSYWHILVSNTHTVQQRQSYLVLEATENNVLSLIWWHTRVSLSPLFSLTVNINSSRRWTSNGRCFQLQEPFSLSCVEEQNKTAEQSAAVLLNAVELSSCKTLDILLPYKPSCSSIQSYDGNK